MEEALIAKEVKIGGDPLEGTRGGEAFQDRDHDGVEFVGDLQVMIDVVAVVAATIREGTHLVEEVAPEAMSENMIGGEALRTSIQARVTVGPDRRPDVITEGAHHLRDDVHHLREGAHHLREEDQ